MSESTAQAGNVSPIQKQQLLERFTSRFAKHCHPSLSPGRSVAFYVSFACACACESDGTKCSAPWSYSAWREKKGGPEKAEHSSATFGSWKDVASGLREEDTVSEVSGFIEIDTYAERERESERENEGIWISSKWLVSFNSARLPQAGQTGINPATLHELKNL